MYLKKHFLIYFFCSNLIVNHIHSIVYKSNLSVIHILSNVNHIHSIDIQNIEYLWCLECVFLHDFLSIFAADMEELPKLCRIKGSYLRPLISRIIILLLIMSTFPSCLEKIFYSLESCCLFKFCKTREINLRKLRVKNT